MNMLQGYVSIGFREDERNDAHVRVSVFVGRALRQRGHAGQLTLRSEEWDELADRLAKLGAGYIEILEPREPSPFTEKAT